MKIPAEGLLASRLPTPAPSHPLREMAVAVSFLFTAAGPRRIFTGFPDATDRVVIYSINGARRKSSSIAQSDDGSFQNQLSVFILTPLEIELE